MEINIKGIKCDNTKCEYKDPEVKFENYSDFVNKPCPSCGANLLTEADFETVQRMMRLKDSKLMKCVESVGDFLGLKKKNYKVDLDGDGNINIKSKE